MGEMKVTRPHWSTVTKIVVSLFSLAFFVYLLFRFNAILAPLTLAVVLAYVLSPLVKLLQARLGLHRGLATILVYLFVGAVIAALPILLLPPLAAQMSELVQDLEQGFSRLNAWLMHPFVIGGQVFDLGELVQSAVGSIQGALEPFVGRTLSLVVEVISSLVWVIFIAVVSAYLVKDGPKLRAWSEAAVPPDYRSDFIHLREEISLIWSAFFRGQLVLAVVVALIISSAGFILGLPFALALGLLAGLLEFLPSIGHGIWLVTAASLALFVGSTWLPLPNWVFMLVISGLHMVFQQFDLNYLIPRIIGRRVHLPPLVVILGIVAGATLAGVLGILLAAPTIASIRIIGRYIYANLFDLDPFPPDPDLSLPADPRWWRKLTPRHPTAPKPQSEGHSEL